MTPFRRTVLVYLTMALCAILVIIEEVIGDTNGD